MFKKLTFAEYWNDPSFAGKKPHRTDLPDNFYRPIDGGLLWVENPVHGPEQFTRDTGGRFVLAFNPSWRFGANGPPLPTEFGLRMTHGRRGERVLDLNDAEWRRLESWLDAQARLKLSATHADRTCSPAPKKSLPPTRRTSRCA